MQAPCRYAPLGGSFAPVQVAAFRWNGWQASAVYAPWENGYNESFNGKLRDELLNGEFFYTLREVQILIEQWRIHYNAVRPHSSLGYRPPAPQTIKTKPKLPAYVQPIPDQIQWHVQLNPN